MGQETYDEIHALRSLEFVAHEREDWRMAVCTAYLAKLWTEDPVSPADIYRLIQADNESDTETVTPAQAAAMGRGNRGELRRPGRQADTRQDAV